MPNDLPSSDERQEAMQAAFPPVSTEAWLRKIAEDLKGADYEQRLVWMPPEGFAVQPFYRAEDLKALTPGLLPLLRRNEANDWHVRQDIVVADVKTANRLARQALAHGATTIGFLFNFPTGQTPISQPKDLERLLDGLPLDTTPIHFVDAPAESPLLAMLFNEAARRGIARASLQGSITTDVLRRLKRPEATGIGHIYAEEARLLEEVEGVRDRVRNQMDSSWRRRGGRFASDVDVEDELQRDEAAETRRADAPSSAHGDQDQAAPEAGSGSSQELRPADLFPDVLGWQPLVLNRDFECGCCARNLHAGESAFLGIASQGLTEVALCGRCAGRR